MSKEKNKYGNPISTGVAIAQQDFQNHSGIRNEHDDDAEFYSSLSQMAGPKPRGAAAAFAGLTEGLAHGAKKNSTAKKQEALSKYDRVMDYFRTQVMEQDKMKKWYETRDFAKTKYLPQVLSYAQNVNNLDPQSRRMMLDDILNGYNQTIGEDYKLSSIDGSNPFIVTLTGKKGAQVVDIRNLFSGDENAQTLLNMQMPEYLKKQQEERQDKERKRTLEEDKFEAYKYDKGLDSKFGKKGEGGGVEVFEYNGHQYDTVPLKGREKGEITDYGKTVNKSVSQIPINERAITSVNSMREVFERNPNIGESWINMLSSGEGEDTWGRWIAKKFATRAERADMEILKKASNDLNLSVVLSVPGKSATDILKRAVQAASPTGTLTKQGFDKISNEWEGRAVDNIDMAQAQGRARAQGKMILSKTVANGSVGTQQPKATMPNDLITVRDPNTGEQDRISPKDLDAAIALGLEQVGEINAD
jgi:hypothetical protein